MDCDASDPLQCKKSEKCHKITRKRPTSLYELSSVVEDTLKIKSCENTLKLNNLVQNVNDSSSHMSANPSIQLTKRNVLRDDTNTHHLRQKRITKDEEKENCYTEVSFVDKYVYLRNITREN